MATKNCYKCNIIKLYEAFAKGNHKGGRQSACKECTKEMRDEIKLHNTKNPRPLVETKKCSRCKKVKTASKFYQHPTTPSGLHSRCKRCSIEGAREQQVLKTYGLTMVQYQNYFDAARGVCGLCGKTPIRSSNLELDHCHKTGKVRGVLCGSCNKGLGFLQDNPDLLRRAAIWIEQHSVEVTRG